MPGIFKSPVSECCSEALLEKDCCTRQDDRSHVSFADST